MSEKEKKALETITKAIPKMNDFQKGYLIEMGEAMGEQNKSEDEHCMYEYRIVKEDFHTGKRGKRTKTILRNRPLAVGGLYCHLGIGFPGCYRVLEERKGDFDDDSDYDYN